LAGPSRQNLISGAAWRKDAGTALKSLISATVRVSPRRSCTSRYLRRTGSSAREVTTHVDRMAIPRRGARRQSTNQASQATTSTGKNNRK
jgi:hypothetical protein